MAARLSERTDDAGRKGRQPSTVRLDLLRTEKTWTSSSSSRLVMDLTH